MVTDSAKLRALEGPLASTPSLVAIGNFDGMHRGHRRLLQKALEEAKREKLVSIVMTFDPHPQRYFGREVLSLLTLPEKQAELASFGFDYVVIQSFGAALASLKAEAFCDQVLRGDLRASHVVVGENFRFGAGAIGDATVLRERGLVTYPIVLENEGGHIISSGRIRRLIHDKGDIKEANALLGAPYFLSGQVVRGDGRGRAMGYPTANIATERECLPRRGVYAAWAVLGPQRVAAAVNIGVRPTFGVTSRLSVEAHLLGFSADLYGHSIRLEFVDRIRDEQKFENIEALRQRIELDCNQVRRKLA